MDILIATTWRILSQLFLVLIIWGLIEWTERTNRPLPREFRHYLIAAGIGVAFIPASCFAGLILYPRGSLVGSWNNYPVASTLGRWNLPLAVTSVVLGINGKGRGRMLLIIGGACLALVWVMAVVPWQSA